jgi:hypothetical protein
MQEGGEKFFVAEEEYIPLRIVFYIWFICFFYPFFLLSGFVVPAVCSKQIELPPEKQFKNFNPRRPDRAVGFAAGSWTRLHETDRIIPPGNDNACFFWYCEVHNSSSLVLWTTDDDVISLWSGTLRL